MALDRIAKEIKLAGKMISEHFGSVNNSSPTNGYDISACELHTTYGIWPVDTFTGMEKSREVIFDEILEKIRIRNHHLRGRDVYG